MSNFDDSWFDSVVKSAGKRPKGRRPNPSQDQPPEDDAEPFPRKERLDPEAMRQQRVVQAKGRSSDELLEELGEYDDDGYDPDREAQEDDEAESFQTFLSGLRDLQRRLEPLDDPDGAAQSEVENLNAIRAAIDSEIDKAYDSEDLSDAEDLLRDLIATRTAVEQAVADRARRRPELTRQLDAHRQAKLVGASAEQTGGITTLIDRAATAIDGLDMDAADRAVQAVGQEIERVRREIAERLAALAKELEALRQADLAEALEGERGKVNELIKLAETPLGNGDAAAAEPAVKAVDTEVKQVLKAIEERRKRLEELGRVLAELRTADLDGATESELKEVEGLLSTAESAVARKDLPVAEPAVRDAGTRVKAVVKTAGERKTLRLQEMNSKVEQARTTSPPSKRTGEETRVLKELDQMFTSALKAGRLGLAEEAFKNLMAHDEAVRKNAAARKERKLQLTQELESLRKLQPTRLPKDQAQVLKDLDSKAATALTGTDVPAAEGAVKAFKEKLDEINRTLEAQLDELRKVVDSLKDPKGSSPDDVAELNDLRAAARERIEARDLRGNDQDAVAAVKRLKVAHFEITESAKPEWVLQELHKAADEKEARRARWLYDKLESLGALGRLMMPVKIKLNKLKIIELEVDTSPYKLDTQQGASHARERHTVSGIWKAKAVLTDHPTSVAIFESTAEFEKALKDTPTDRRAWKGKGGARVDAFLRGVVYQGTVLGDTVSLFSFYPVNGPQFPKAEVARVLSESKTEKDFDLALQDLVKTLGL
jgi:hypothetical protein